MLMWWEHPLVLSVGGAAVLIAGIATIWGKGIVPTYRACVRFFKAVGQFADSIDTLFGIAKEFKPNGGSSFHDMMADLRGDVSELKSDMAEVKLDVSEVKRQVETIITEELPIITALAEHVTETDDRR